MNAQMIKTSDTTLELADNTACAVLGGSSLTSLSPSGEVKKNSFYPTTVEEYFSGLVDITLEHGRLHKNQKGVVMIAAAGAFQNEGTTAGLTQNFHRVIADAHQRGMPNFFFRQMIEEEYKNRGYNQIQAFAYNDTVPALMATICQPNTDKVLGEFEQELGGTRADYAIKYIINGTGTGEATLYPDTQKVVTAEKGHLKPTLLWYQLNPFFKFITRFSIVGQNRSIERLMAGGPTERTPRHFSKILLAVIDILKDQTNPEIEELARIIGFQDYRDLVAQDDSENGLLHACLEEDDKSIMQVLGKYVQANNPLAMALRKIFAKALGTSVAYMHYAIGEMPDAPLHTFVGTRDIRESALGFIRTDGSTTALLGNDGEAWDILNRAAQDYANSILNMGRCEQQNHLFKILNINEVFPNIHPDFGGLPRLAQMKLEQM